MVPEVPSSHLPTATPAQRRESSFCLHPHANHYLPSLLPSVGPVLQWASSIQHVVLINLFWPQITINHRKWRKHGSVPRISRGSASWMAWRRTCRTQIWSGSRKNEWGEWWYHNDATWFKQILGRVSPRGSGPWDLFDGRKWIEPLLVQTLLRRSSRWIQDSNHQINGQQAWKRKSPSE